MNTPVTFDKPVPIYIQVLSDVVDVLKGVNKESRRVWAVRRQFGHIFSDGLTTYPKKFGLYLGNDDPVYPNGWYCLLPQSFSVDENENLITRPKLMPVDDPRSPKKV
jgi:hypothetical protein